MMTKAQRDEIRARVNAASPYPWRITETDIDNRVGGIEDAAGFEVVTTDAGMYAPERPDADLIASAPADLIALLDALDEMDRKYTEPTERLVVRP